ncbi:MAG: glycerol-3-phosphate dehydrogenase/oxidase [Flavisolibacter sp.]
MIERKNILKQLADTKPLWDIVVIGGGATGLGVALDAVTRGYHTLLVEQSDLAKGTSSRSTKLVHGGVRYLSQGDFGLVREASIERGLLYKNAPHLVKNLSFIIPIYHLFDRIKYTIGLKLYDWISGKLSLGPSVFISRKNILDQLPGITTKGLLGGVLYHDGQFDDARLALNLAQTIREKGGAVLNYAKVTGLLKGKREWVEGVVLEDMETGLHYTVPAKAVVNATGVFVDEILQMDNPSSPSSICVSQGVHLVFDKSFYPSPHALMIPETRDGRVLFAVPWHDRVVVGTTDTPVGEASLEPKALETEINFILETASAYFTKIPRRSDVLSVFAGLRPLAAPQGHYQKTKEISRRHKIIVSPSKLFTILGGKWTIYRRMGEDMINRIEKELGWPTKKSLTAHLPVHGFTQERHPENPLDFYGSDAPAIQKKINESDEEWLSGTLKIHPVQVEWAVECEMARTVEDVLSRRTRALILDPLESLRICPAVARTMAGVLGKDERWIAEQVVAYTQLAQQYMLH